MCKNCEVLERKLASALRERDDARKAASKAFDLILKGESAEWLTAKARQLKMKLAK